MSTETPKTIYLKDYKSFPIQILSIELDIALYENHALTSTRMQCKKLRNEPLFLNGEDIELLELKINENILFESGAIKQNINIKDFEIDAKGLKIAENLLPDEFSLMIKTKIHPENNTRLEGLYKSGGTYCTQCEAEGFRRITYFPDRPDVLTTYKVRIEADKKTCPVLLSNGNHVGGGDLSQSRHFSIWEDPFPKPCYLFALVAGDLNHIHDTYTTRSGRKVDLYIYVRPGDESQCAHAMESLKKSMKWDEDVYGLEYDLNIFNIVAVSDFNMGAMENKSLNIFNTALVLAHQETATDADFMRVESVIAHEYFHNWSGNRVTCRDWFQLSLKEGLTVFRDQEFSSDMHSRDVQRIDDVTHLRRLQFTEDSGPLAHPVRPDNYIEINNFYTMTVYEKGAEVIRMMRTLLGKENYRKGTDLYFMRHDGQAVTCEDFVKCMEDASGIDLTQFKLWYSQAGTPQIRYETSYDENAKNFTINLKQTIPDTPGQTGKKPMLIPVSIGLLDKAGREFDLADGQKTQTIHFTKAEQSFTFEKVENRPIPSLLRGFSAPVILKSTLSDEELAFLMVHDSDGFNRWDSGQTYTLRVLNKMLDNAAEIPSEYIDNFGTILKKALSPSEDKALIARMLHIPEVSEIARQRDEIDTDAIYQAREDLLNTLLESHREKLEKIYEENIDKGPFSTSSSAMGKRALKNSSMLLLSNKRMKEDAERCKKAYLTATNMTDRIASLHAHVNFRTTSCEEIIADFYERFKSYPLVIDKWFSAQATAIRSDTLETLKKLQKHPDFNIRNPNRARSLFAAFAMNNPVCFHAEDGSGYDFLKDAIIELNTINPQIAARLMTPLRDWKRYTSQRRKYMKATLENILLTHNLSPDVFEIASKSLQG